MKSSSGCTVQWSGSFSDVGLLRRPELDSAGAAAALQRQGSKATQQQGTQWAQPRAL
jgi:hypothetical protein